MLVDSGEYLRAQVTTLKQRTEEHFVGISSQLRERAMTCINERETDEKVITVRRLRTSWIWPLSEGLFILSIPSSSIPHVEVSMGNM